MTGNLNWIKGYQSRSEGPTPHTQRASYSLRDLALRSFLKPNAVRQLLHDADLSDFSWHVVWGEDYATTDEELEDRLSNVDGYVIFIHGWTGSNAIWENLPGMVINRNRNLVSLVVDHNGFGATPFVQSMPEMDSCNPVAAMTVVEHWFDLLQLRRQPGEPKPKTINFVGHSMGGAALFFLHEENWKFAEATRTAIAPALLLHDELHRAFYTTLGLGIGLVGRIRALQIIDNVVSPSVLEVLAEGATQHVKDEHARIYEITPKGVTARTFAAMGAITQHPEPHQWDLFQVVLGHRDRLVGLVPMLDLLQDLNFDVNQVRVVMGTHYLFSVGNDMQRWHEQNRELVLKDILDLHGEALQRQKTGKA
ncbi:MAG: alpha/beta hydrolase [Chloroflexota bacterium]